MSRADEHRLADVVAAIDAIQAHLSRGDLSDGLVYDAVRLRLIEVGEAVKGLSADVRDREPEVPWSAIARMRDQLAHRYFDTDRAVVVDVVAHELGPLRGAVLALLGQLAERQLEDGSPG